MDIVHLDDKNFKSEVVNSKIPVLVDFWADWCGPCKRMAPVIDELAKECSEKVKIAKLDVEEGRQAATEYGIMSIPTIVLFKDGKIVKQVVGVVSKNELKSIIDNNIK